MSLSNIGLVSRFKMFSLEHYLPFGITFIVLVILVSYAYKKPIEVKRRIGLILSFTSLIANIIFNLKFHANSDMSSFFPQAFPLWYCGLIAPVAVYGFLRMSSLAFSFVYVIGMTGNLVACITPEVYYGFPNIEYIAFFICHPLNLLIPLYIIMVFPFRMTWLNYLTTLGLSYVIIFISHGINLLYGTNFNYTVSKPTTLTLMDILGEWPYYLIFTGIIGTVISFIFFMALKFKPEGKTA